MDHAEQRQRRRAHMTIVYDGEFDLAAEVAAVTEHLAERVPTNSTPLAFRSHVAELADATQELVGIVVGWLAEVHAMRRTEHLAYEPGKRAHAIRLLVDLARRPELVETGDESMITGSCVAPLVSMADPFTEPLAALLARSWPPNHDALRARTLSRQAVGVRVAARRRTQAAPRARYSPGRSHSNSGIPAAHGRWPTRPRYAGAHDPRRRSSNRCRGGRLGGPAGRTPSPPVRLSGCPTNPAADRTTRVLDVDAG